MVDRRLLKQNVFCLVDSLSPLHVKLSLDLALSFCFIICLLNKPLLLSASPALLLMHMHSLVSCGTSVSTAPLAFIYFTRAAREPINFYLF